jgi:mRNA (2'-O-methyladenosine-N6-)-methyltransferase
MSSDALRVVAASALYTLFSSGRASAPITSTQLLIRVITTKTPPGLLPNTSTAPRFRLTDLRRFESILDSFSPTWEHGTLSLSRESGELVVMDVSLAPSSAQLALGENLNPRKRKRVVDEEADSAAGDDDAEDPSFESPVATTLGSLSKELREVYAIIQKGTAKGRLLAEQVCTPLNAVVSPSNPSPVSICGREIRANLSTHHERRLRQGAQAGRDALWRASDRAHEHL